MLKKKKREKGINTEKSERTNVLFQIKISISNHVKALTIFSLSSGHSFTELSN